MRSCGVRLETGRTHQIRVHLAAIDLPVSGDPVYGVPGDLGPRAPVPARGAPRLSPPVRERSTWTWNLRFRPTWPASCDEFGAFGSAA